MDEFYQRLYNGYDYLSLAELQLICISDWFPGGRAEVNSHWLNIIWYLLIPYIHELAVI